MCLHVVCESSPAYNTHNVDLFELLQEDINHFSCLGIVYVCGDFNARVGTRSDYIVCDYINIIWQHV